MELDINKIRKKNENIKIGELSDDVINLLNLNCKPQNIYLWGARIDEHCEKWNIQRNKIKRDNLHCLFSNAII